MQLKTDITWRIILVYAGMLLAGILIIGKVVYLQFWKNDYWQEKAEEQTYKNEMIEPNRGDICADDGRLLATSVPFYEIRMDLLCDGMSDEFFNKNVDSLAIALSEMFGDKTPGDYVVELRNARINGARYHLIRKKVNFAQLQKLKTFPIFREGKYKGGFIVLQSNRREKPNNELAARTIGYLTQNNKAPVVGIEGAYHHFLKGVEGMRIVRRIAGGMWAPVSEGYEIEPQNGKDIITTLNLSFQDVVQNALLDQLTKFNALHGTAILMEVKTGEVKAIANLTRDTLGNYAETYNYAIGESTEPGSTFKLASLIVALEDGAVDLNDTIDTGNGVFNYHGFIIRDTKRGGHGRITVQQALEVSSNVGIAKIIINAYEDNPRRFIDRLYSMGLNQKLGIAIRGEPTPYIKYPDDTLWSAVSLPQMSIGYELRMTPLQVLAFYNAVANNGQMVRPRFVKEIRQYGQTLQTFEPEVLNSAICSQSTLHKVTLALAGVVERGTAYNIRSENFTIAGKTGTAQIANRSSGYRDDNNRVSYQASFAGFFPAENPKYSCIVVVNTPENVYYGSVVAAPVFKQIAEKVYALSLDIHEGINENNETYLADIPYSKSGAKRDLDIVFTHLDIPVEYDENLRSPWVVTQKQSNCVHYGNRIIRSSKMPRVIGMGARDALYILENIGLKVEIQGRGTVISQSIDAGSAIGKGDKVVIKLA